MEKSLKTRCITVHHHVLSITIGEIPNVLLEAKSLYRTRWSQFHRDWEQQQHLSFSQSYVLVANSFLPASVFMRYPLSKTVPNEPERVEVESNIQSDALWLGAFHVKIHVFHEFSTIFHSQIHKTSITSRIYLYITSTSTRKWNNITFNIPNSRI